MYVGTKNSLALLTKSKLMSLNLGLFICRHEFCEVTFKLQSSKVQEEKELSDPILCRLTQSKVTPLLHRLIRPIDCDHHHPHVATSSIFPRSVLLAKLEKFCPGEIDTHTFFPPFIVISLKGASFVGLGWNWKEKQHQQQPLWLSSMLGL